MHLKTDIPHLKDAGVTLLWDMALQNGHSKQKFYASLALFICCRVNVVWSGAKTRKGNRGRGQEKVNDPHQPSDTRLWKYIRVLANICERTYLLNSRPPFQIPSDDLMNPTVRTTTTTTTTPPTAGLGGLRRILHTFADLVHDRLKAAACMPFINALPPSLAKRRFKHICGWHLTSLTSATAASATFCNIRCPTGIHHQMATPQPHRFQDAHCQRWQADCPHAA